MELGSAGIENRRRFQKTLFYLAEIATLSLACGTSATLIPLTPNADSFPDNRIVHQNGTATVDGDGEPLRLRGVNLGDWLHWEGWDFSRGADISENRIDAGLAELAGQAAVEGFHERMYGAFIAEADFRAIASYGFNSVHLPVNYAILEDDSRPYIYKECGWTLIDRALDWCEQFGLYAILDLHAAPGGQSGLAPSNSDPGEPKLRLLITNSVLPVFSVDYSIYE